ncbi:MAG: tetratricopeptide repeat protein, partial [Alphaproteobacteria bacterium]
MTTLFLPGWTTRVLIMAGIIGLCIASSPGETATPTEGDLDRAFDAVLADPSDIDAAFEYARIAAALGDYEAAISSLERMLIFDPNLLKVKVELGVLYFRLGSYETAKSYFDQALAHE